MSFQSGNKTVLKNYGRLNPKPSIIIDTVKRFVYVFYLNKYSLTRVGVFKAGSGKTAMRVSKFYVAQQADVLDSLD
jgi:hypothetical protein